MQQGKPGRMGRASGDIDTLCEDSGRGDHIQLHWDSIQPMSWQSVQGVIADELAVWHVAHE